MADSLTDALAAIGLNRYEAAVYVELVRKGRTTAGPIIKATKFHRQVVYTALESLTDRGLVSYVLYNNRRQFSALPPEDLHRRESERFRSFSNVIPSLKALQKKATGQLHVETFVGAHELMQALFSATDSAARNDGLLRIIGGERASELYGFMGARYSEYVQYVYDKGVSKRLITTPSAIEQYKERLGRERRAKLRSHDLGYSAPTFSLVTHDLLDLGIISDEVVIVRVWNNTIARTYVEQFELLWKLGKRFRVPRRAVTKAASPKIR